MGGKIGGLNVFYEESGLLFNPGAATVQLFYSAALFFLSLS